MKPPKQKARELVEKFFKLLGGHNKIQDEFEWTNAKQCAIIAVDEILQIFEGLDKPEYCAFDCLGGRKYEFESEYETHMTGYDMVAYFEEVKQEIEML